MTLVTKTFRYNFWGSYVQVQEDFFTEDMNFLEIPLVLHQRSSFLIATLRSKDLHLFYSNKKEQKKIHEKGIWQKSCRETFSRLIFELCMIATNHYCYITVIFVSNRMSGSSKRAKKANNDTLATFLDNTQVISEK